MTAREFWKWHHRQQRVIARETLKAMHDLVIWGHGAVLVEPGKDPRHIPFKELRHEPPTTP